MSLFSKSFTVSFSIFSFFSASNNLFAVNSPCSDVSLDFMKFFTFSSVIAGSILNDAILSLITFFSISSMLVPMTFTGVVSGETRLFLLMNDTNAHFAESFSSNLEKLISDRFPDNKVPFTLIKTILSVRSSICSINELILSSICLTVF